MFDVKKMIEEIPAKKEIKNVSFVGCGGSLACFFAPHYYVTHEAKTLTTLYENANEFTNDTPAFINENAIVVCASRRGNTPQTVEAAKKALYTGNIGDGKIFVYGVENAIKVRTGQEGFDALQGEEE